jgi:hypothetical protein
MAAPSEGDGASAHFGTLDERIASERSRHSCLRRLDEFMFCMTLSNQLDDYYKNGTYGDCPKLFARWQTCMKAKVSKPAEAEALLQSELHSSTTGEHVFLFRPSYADEARKRYGIPDLKDTQRPSPAPRVSREM